MVAGTETSQETMLQEMVTLQHRLSNQLTATAGRAQLLSMDPQVPPALRADVARIVDAALATVHTWQRLRELTDRAQRHAP